MEAFFLFIPKRLFQTLFLFLSFILLAHCNQKSQREVYPSFYYWKTNFALTEKEKGLLYRLSIKYLYMKFFDVEWNDLPKTLKPIVAINFKQSPPAAAFFMIAKCVQRQILAPQYNYDDWKKRIPLG